MKSRAEEAKEKVGPGGLRAPSRLVKPTGKVDSEAEKKKQAVMDK